MRTQSCLVLSYLCLLRKPLFVCCQLFPGIFCIIAAFLEPGIKPLTMTFQTSAFNNYLMAGTGIYAVLALTAKLGAAMAFNVTFMFTAQLYPTSIRFTTIIFLKKKRVKRIT